MFKKIKEKWNWTIDMYYNLSIVFILLGIVLFFIIGTGLIGLIVGTVFCVIAWVLLIIGYKKESIFSSKTVLTIIDSVLFTFLIFILWATFI